MGSSKDGFKPRSMPFFMGDPLLLTNPGEVRYNPDYETTKNRLAKGEWFNQLLNIDSDFAYGISTPMPMAPINMKVLQASSIALNYGTDFTAKERFSPLGFFWARTLGLLGFIPAILFQICLLWTVIIVKIPVIGRAIVNFIAPAGSGVPDFLCEMAKTSVYATATSKVKENSGKVDRGYAYLSRNGDAGNLVTAQCVSECALALVLNRDGLPERSSDGFGTPAEIFGDVLLKRFQECQVRPVQVKTIVRTDAQKNETKLYMN